MREAFCLDQAYSTTRHMTRMVPVVSNPSDANLNSMLFLLPHPQRKGEGGLRSQGYFKANSRPNPNVVEVTVKPLITVITVVFNGAKTLEQTILSVINQSYDIVEYIIVDGGSTDGTLDIIRKYEHAIDYWISEPDKGIYEAWNKGLRCASGDWICFVGADDYFWDANALMRAAEKLVTLPNEIRVAYGQVMLVNNGGENLYPIGEQWEKLKDRFRQIMCIPHPGLMHRRSLFEQYGQFDESFRIAGDYELLLRELRVANAFYIPDLIMVAMRQGGISSNPANTLLGLGEVRRAQRKNGQYFPKALWLMALIRVYIRLMLWKLLGDSAARRTLDLGRKIMGLPAFWTKT